MLKFQPKICQRCGRTFTPTSGVQRYCPDCREVAYVEWKARDYQRHADEVKARSKKWREEHPEQYRNYLREWQDDHRAEERDLKRKWAKAHPEKVYAGVLKWHRANPDKVYASYRHWQEKHPEAIRTINRKRKAKRRHFEFIPLNAPFEGCEGHHIDPKQVIYIPREVHQAIRHNLFTGKNMNQINAIAYNFLFKQEVEAALAAKERT